MNTLHDVIIAGAGPIGLFLACELRLAGVDVLVLERDSNPESAWKTKPMGLRGLNTPSVEYLYRRGLLHKLSGYDSRASSFEKKPGFSFGGHFAGISIDANKLDLGRWKYRLNGPALVPNPTTIEDLEKVLAERAVELGATILRGSGVTKVVMQDESSVTVEADDNRTFLGRWLVGCDGGRSTVRKAAGFEFVGTEARWTGYVFKCDLDHPENLNPGFNPTQNGMYIRGMPGSLYLVDFDGGAFDRSQKITEEYAQKVLNRITEKEDVTITKIHVSSSFADRAKQATHYRKGRILIAGDAAHIHPPLGAQGLNLGLGDATNLGWKLAATIRQESKSPHDSLDLTLLDTYETEQRPKGEWVLEWTRAQTATIEPGLYGEAVRNTMRKMIDTVDGANLFLGDFWGLSQRHDLSSGETDTHPLIGCSVPEFELDDGSRLGTKMQNGRGLLVELGSEQSLQQMIGGTKYEKLVDYIAMSAKDTCGLRAVLVRPDGIVAWVVEDGQSPDLETLKTALERWFAF